MKQELLDRQLGGGSVTRKMARPHLHTWWAIILSSSAGIQNTEGFALWWCSTIIKAPGRGKPETPSAGHISSGYRRPYLKAIGAVGRAQSVESLICKHRGLSLNPSTHRKAGCKGTPLGLQCGEGRDGDPCGSLASQPSLHLGPSEGPETDPCPTVLKTERVGAWNPSTWETEARGSEVQGRLPSATQHIWDQPEILERLSPIIMSQDDKIHQWLSVISAEGVGRASTLWHYHDNGNMLLTFRSTPRMYDVKLSVHGPGLDPQVDVSYSTPADYTTLFQDSCGWRDGAGIHGNCVLFPQNRYKPNQKLLLKNRIYSKRKKAKNIAYVSWRSWDLSLENLEVVWDAFGRRFRAFCGRVSYCVSKATALFTICQNLTLDFLKQCLNLNRDPYSYI